MIAVGPSNGMLRFEIVAGEEAAVALGAEDVRGRLGRKTAYCMYVSGW